ncbi:MAG TPA: hypothetical protein VM734_18095 [Kofleriaceae bacterium]|jgi:hypothetical protein|nr:hypothetical protein [Kofleriaceae bacterium]
MRASLQPVAVVLALWLGCTRDPPRDTGASAAASSPAAATKETHVYDVTSANDLLTVQSAYLARAAAGFDGTFEVRFAATIPPTGWRLAPEAGKDVPAIDLVLRGDGAVIPAPERLVARSVRLEGLVVTGPVGLSSVVEVRTGFTMVDSAIIDGRSNVPASQAPYLAIRAHGVRGKKAPATLTIERSWFVRNWQTDQSVHGATLVGLEQDARDGGFFGEVRLRDCVFVGNAFATELRLAYALDVAIERSLFYKTWPSGVQIAADLTDKVRVIDSTLIAEDLGHVAQVGADASPIAVTGSRIYARSYTAATPVPAALAIDRGAIADRSAIDARTAPLDAAAKMGVALPPASLRDELVRAVRP